MSMSRETKRPGMVLYHDKYRALSALSDHDFRLVIDALMRYSETGEQAEISGYLGAIYQLLAAKLDEDIARYDRTVEARREAGRKGGYAKAAKAAEESERLANAGKTKQKLANAANQSPSQSPISNQSQKGNQISLPLPPRGKEDGETGERIPSVSEVMAYARDASLSCDETAARRFLAVQAAKGWRDSNGQAIRNWRTWFEGWLGRDGAAGPAASARPTPTSMQYEQRVYTPEMLERIGTAWLRDDEGSDSA